MISLTEVPVIVYPDGTKKVVAKSAVIDGKMTLELPADCTLELEERKTEFKDVSEKHWANSSITFATSRALFKGISETQFAPTSKVSREMFTTVLARLEGVNQSDAANWAEENSISDGSKAHENISREDLVTMLYRYVGQQSVDNLSIPFKDASKVSSYAQAAMAWETSEGLLNGYQNGTIHPTGQVTKAEVSAILERMIKKSFSE